MKIAACILFLSILVSGALADDIELRNASSHYLMLFYGESAMIFGSEDVRVGGGLAYAYGQPEKRFTRGAISGQLVSELYGDYTQSNGSQGYPPDWSIAFGGLAYARWRWPVDQHGNGLYADLGWGLQYANKPTLDLESQFNSTPVGGVGAFFKYADRECLVGFRYLHISNAGFKPPNYGQNEMFFTVGVRY